MLLPGLSVTKTGKAICAAVADAVWDWMVENGENRDNSTLRPWRSPDCAKGSSGSKKHSNFCTRARTVAREFATRADSEETVIRTPRSCSHTTRPCSRYATARRAKARLSRDHGPFESDLQPSRGARREPHPAR